MARKISIKAVRHSYYNEPVIVAIDGMEDPKDLGVSLVEIGTGRAIPAQVMNRQGDCIHLCIVVDALPKGESREFEIGCSSSTTDGVNLIDDGKKVEFRIGGKLFTAYHYVSDLPRPFMFPLIGPGGVNVTRRFPMEKDVPGETSDHKHHRSLWVAFGDLNGADGWSEEPGHAVTVHKEFLDKSSGPAFGRIKTLNDWLDSSGNKIMEEEREVIVYNVTEHARLIDLRVVFKATQGDVRFGDTKEGGIVAIRVATSMDGNKGGLITNSYGGVTEIETWGKRAHWCDYSGPVESQTVGITIFDNPANFRYPTYWHVRDYGLMTANPFALSAYKRDPNVDGSYILKAGEIFPFAYRIYIHSGDVIAGNVAEKYHGYINPPVVAVE
ncbi:MAG: PmoA family protein [Armatimonadota bacterium]|nr:PmoA family protein [Armatimonadota bacterium]